MAVLFLWITTVLLCLSLLPLDSEPDCAGVGEHSISCLSIAYIRLVITKPFY